LIRFCRRGRAGARVGGSRDCRPNARIVGVERESPRPFEQDGEHDPRLESGERRADAEVDVVGALRHPARDPAVREHVADRFDLGCDIQFHTRVTAATWDKGAQRWDIVTYWGDRAPAQFCIMATAAHQRPLS
jgi:hypothetical protein